MLELALALGAILALYVRTFWYKNLIDDAVPMRDYLYVVPDSVPPAQFFLQRSKFSARCWAILCHMLNTGLVYLLLGGKAALLFSVFPICVFNVAWITGSYYATTTFLTLTAFYFLTHVGGLIGVAAGLTFFAAALNSTVATIAFPFVFLFGNFYGLATVIPLVLFLTGKRFTVGKEIRKKLKSSPKLLSDAWTWRRPVVMVKVLGLYVFTALFPAKLCFFRSFGEQFLLSAEVRKEFEAFNGLFFSSVALIGSFILLGVVTGQFFWAMWFLVLMSAFSQFRVLGQFFTERYMYPAIVGVVAVLAQLPDIFVWVLVGAYAVRTAMFIPTFESQKTLWWNGLQTDPECAGNYSNLCEWFLLMEQDLNLAYVLCQRHLQKHPGSWIAHMNLSAFFMFCHDYEKAVMQIEMAKEKGEGYMIGNLAAVVERQLETSKRMLQAQKDANAARAGA